MICAGKTSLREVRCDLQAQESHQTAVSREETPADRLVRKAREVGAARVQLEFNAERHQELLREFGAYREDRDLKFNNCRDMPDITTPEECRALLHEMTAASPGAFEQVLLMSGGGYRMWIATNKPLPLSIMTGIRSREDTAAVIDMLYGDGHQLVFGAPPFMLMAKNAGLPVEGGQRKSGSSRLTGIGLPSQHQGLKALRL